MDYVEFGRYLSQQRELRGMSREEVSRATKISVRLLSALEEGQLERLPARVFVINHLRAYAQAIGLSAEDAVLRFEEIDQAPDTPPLPAPGRSRRSRAFLALAVLLLLLAVAGLALTGRLPLSWSR